MPVERQKICPQCRGPVVRVRNDGPFNDEQFDSAKSGDYYCESCPDNGRGQSGLCYWWASELPPVHDYQI